MEFLGKKWEFPWKWKPKWLRLQPNAFHRNSMEFRGIPTFHWESSGIYRNSWRRVKTSNSGSLGDFMSSTIADQLKVKKEKLASPLGLQLAVQGSCFKINAGAVVEFEYQKIKEKCYFDIINLSSYDLILGTPWLYQHQVCLGLTQPVYW